ncbi:hypothetical protein ACFWGI_36715 [Streptomyces niveus]|uniref:hypothetical protein n=1 Tax=Streptomyces niveus TaxID=193462 RepID=UPI00365DCDA3
MPDTDRLYALSSTHNHPWLSDTPGPALLIHDAIVAMRWYLTHEREETLAVAAHVSDDDGATWRDLPPGELLPDAERALVEQAQKPRPDDRHAAPVLRDALAAEAADWLDHRIRYVQPDDPSHYRPPTPAPSSWRRGGQIWALALGTIPHEQVLDRLKAQYTDPQPEGPQWARTGARDTLEALVVADDPTGAGIGELLGALRHLHPLTFGIELGQLSARAEEAQHRLLDHLVTRHPRTAPVAGAHPDPQHPAQQAARAYLHRLSHITASGEEGLLNDAAEAFTEALAAAEAARPPATEGPATGSPETPAIPGYPKHLAGDLQAAAQWRLISPAARRAADRTMISLAHVATNLTQARADAAPRRFGPRENQTMDLYTDLGQELGQLDARHALLMHAHVLAEAEAAGVVAGHHAIVAAAQEDEKAPRPRTGAELAAGHEKFMAQVNAAQDRIAHTLGAQRQVVRDALHRLFPQIGSSTGLNRLRAQLIDNSGLGFDAYNRAWRAVSDTARTLGRLESGYRSRTAEFGRPPVTAEQVEHARTAAREADAYFTELRSSRLLTLTAIRSLDGVAGLEPSFPDPVAARAARVMAQSRQRTQQAAPARPRSGTGTDQRRQTHSPQDPRRSGVRLQ